MSLIGATQFLERIQFFNGQRLFASDLEAVEAFHREMRWLHNQSLHQAGVGSGLAISGKKGDREVVIQTGYAIDSMGREIVLTEPRTVPVPPVANDGFGRSAFFDLTIAYPDEADLEQSETRESVCGGEHGTVRLAEEPIVCWVRLGPAPDRLPQDPKLAQDVQKGRRLRLARAEVLECKLEQPLSLAQRRNARPQVQPYVACGMGTAAGWTATFTDFGYLLSTNVDTASAKFRTIPRYSAHVLGERRFVFKDNGSDFVRMLDGFLSIQTDAVDTTEFRATVLILEVSLKLDMTRDKIIEQLEAAVKGPNNWRVQWLGVEG